MAGTPKNAVDYGGVGAEEWESIFAPTIHEFAATRFAYTTENYGQIRIAFGNHGPFTGPLGQRDSPRYTHALTISPDVAVELAQFILQQIAKVPLKSD